MALGGATAPMYYEIELVASSTWVMQMQPKRAAGVIRI
jgi:hypothetical protein